MSAKIVGVIPAHLASVRFPRKILHPIRGLPMIEHVRRRALRCAGLAGVYVATCDDEIAQAVSAAGGSVIATSSRHTNGTSRVAEAVAAIDCTHVILLQGDEPLLLPSQVEAMIAAMRSETPAVAWNLTGPINEAAELDRHSFVKCVVGADERIVFCCRRSPCFSDFETQRRFIRKILGIIGYRRDFLLRVVSLPEGEVERAESIEQMRIIENGFFLRAVAAGESLPSINEPHEVEQVLAHLERDAVQAKLLHHIIGETC